MAPTTPPADYVAIAPLAPRVDASTPAALEMSLVFEANVYRIGVQAYIRAGTVTRQTPCQEADVWRVGPHAVSWPQSSAFTLPLRYSVDLPDGLYDEQVDLRVFSYAPGLSLSGHLQSTMRPFEVVDGVLHPLTYAEYRSRVSRLREAESLDAVASAAQTPTPLPPCSAAARVTDEAELEASVSGVYFDTWDAAGSLQPLRLDAATRTLRYQTTASEDWALRLQIPLPADIASGPASISLERSSLMLAPPRPRQRDEVWLSRSGTAHVRTLEDGRLSIELSDVVMENGFDATRLRSVPSGSIVGIWIESP